MGCIVLFLSSICILMRSLTTDIRSTSSPFCEILSPEMCNSLFTNIKCVWFLSCCCVLFMALHECLEILVSSHSGFLDLCDFDL